MNYEQEQLIRQAFEKGPELFCTVSFFTNIY